MNRRAKGGFTLIELLVVIAIIGILATILFPVFARVREKARAASCISNLKQLSMAIIQYADDHDGFGPLSHTSGCYNDTSGAELTGGRCNSALALGDYGAGWASYYIQTGAPWPGPQLVSSWDVNGVWKCPGNGVGTYKMFANRGGTWNMWSLTGASIAGSVRDPAKAGLIGDCWAWQAMSATPPSVVYGYWWQFIAPRSPDNIRNSPPDFNSVTYQRYLSDYAAHNGGNNMAFVDGHAKWMSARDMMACDWWVYAFQ